MPLYIDFQRNIRPIARGSITSGPSLYWGSDAPVRHSKNAKGLALPALWDDLDQRYQRLRVWSLISTMRDINGQTLPKEIIG
jgi:hypothetical protein